MFKMWIGCQDLKSGNFLCGMAPSGSLGTGLLFCRDRLAPAGVGGALSAVSGLLPVEKYPSARQHGEGLEPPREEGVAEKMEGDQRGQQETRHPGVDFIPFTKLSPSIQRLPCNWREPLGSPFTPCCSHYTGLCSDSRRLRALRKMRLLGTNGFRFSDPP